MTTDAPAFDDVDACTARSIALLGDLVAFDTTSRESNLALIGYVETYLAGLGVDAVRVASADGRKSNLYATIGPATEGGVVLSGHSDVVPVDDQPWTHDPFTMTERDGNLFGRGTADMKGFIACALGAAPLFAEPGRLKRPVHLAISYDEEIGCLGAPAMIREMVRTLPWPSSVVIGEPTLMQAVGAHKGIAAFQVTVRGEEAHSSMPHRGVSANMIAIDLMKILADIARELAAAGDPASPFVPPYTTLTVGVIKGGTAPNILAGECTFCFDFRAVPGDDHRMILRPFLDEIERINADVRRDYPNAGITLETMALGPALGFERGGDAEALVRGITGDNGDPRTVSYGTEAGQFQEAGFSTIICGPGSMDQGHKADEFIAVEQMRRCSAFMIRLAERLAA